MTTEERVVAMSAWNSLLVLLSLLYLEVGFFRAFIVSAFVGISCTLGFGRRWLLRGGLALSLAALAVLLGFPSPQQWPEIAKTAPDTLQSLRASIFATRE
jgi:hypothetical protein